MIIENNDRIERIKRLKEVSEMIEMLLYELEVDDNPPDYQYISKIDKSIEVLKETQNFLECIYTLR